VNLNMIKKAFNTTLIGVSCIVLYGCSSSNVTNNVTETFVAAKTNKTVPAQKFDLSYWNITIPLDLDGNDKPDTIAIPDILNYSHADFFYLNSNNQMVFAAPNKAITTPNSSNTRSELRHMSRGLNKDIGTKDFGNNFAIAAHDKASEFASVGGKLEATLSVNHVALRAGNPEKYPAYSAVVGQIHAVKESEFINHSGYGNEPLKIYFKKLPNHSMGSVFWTYERNLEKENPDRRDFAYPVWGNTWDITTDPGVNGIALDEEFSYTINVHENIMYLTFENDRLGTVNHVIDLSNNVDANGQVDSKDNPNGYSQEQLYFKAGIYNQCSTKDAEGFWYAACPGTGDWAVDKANGDYAQSTFSKLILSSSEPVN